VTVILVLTVQLAFGQLNNNKTQKEKHSNTDNLYELVLTRLVDTVRTKYKYLIKNDTMIIYCDYRLSPELPTKINGINIFYGNDTKHYKTNRVAYNFTFSPIFSLPNNKLNLTIYLDMQFEGSVMDCAGAGCTAIISFDCQRNKFIIENFWFNRSLCAEEK
jgi:hypothetical protein